MVPMPYPASPYVPHRYAEGERVTKGKPWPQPKLFPGTKTRHPLKAVLGSRLQGSLNADQGISQLGCFGRAIILFVHDHSFVGLETETRSQSKPKMALAGILIGLQKNDIYLKYND